MKHYICCGTLHVADVHTPGAIHQPCMLLFHEDVHCKQHRLCIISRMLQPAVTTVDRPQSAEQAATSHTAQHACCHGAYSTGHGNSLATHSMQMPWLAQLLPAAPLRGCYGPSSKHKPPTQHLQPTQPGSAAASFPANTNANAHLLSHHPLHLQQRASTCKACIGSMQSLTVPRRFNTTLRRVKS